MVATFEVPPADESKVGRCRLTQSNPSRNRAWLQRLKLECDEPLSNVAFKFYLRCYNKVVSAKSVAHSGLAAMEPPHVLVVEDTSMCWKVATHGCCSPRHRMPLNSRHQASNAFDDVGSTIQCSPRHRMPLESRNQGLKCV